jgi:hypothetical protein
MQIQIQEARIIIAIEVIRTFKKLSRRAVTKCYNIPELILHTRISN